MSPRWATFRVRVSLWYVGLLALLVVGLSVAIFLILRASLHESLDEDLANRVALVRASIQFDDGAPSLGAIPRRLGDDPEESFVRLLSVEGGIVESDSGVGWSLPVSSETVVAALSGRPSRRTIRAFGETYRVTAAPLRRGDEIVAVLEVGVSREDTDEALGSLLLILLVAAPATIAVAGGGGLLLAGRALRPLRDVTSVAQRMSADALNQRIDYKGPRDELGRLAETFDGMLERLEAAFRQQQRFTEDAAHELRTPLTAIQGQVEVALQRDRGPADYTAVLRRVADQSQRLSGLVDSLLLLARADGGLPAGSRHPVDIAGLVREVIAASEAEARRRGVGLRSAPGAADSEVSGDPILLQRLITNLVENALVHTPRGRSVEIGWRRDPTHVETWVADTGPGIPPAERERIFDRFYRVDAARSRRDGGVGLGLAIAEAHGGSIRAENRQQGGALFTVRLPAHTSNR